jgi:hypothetical protein
MTRQPDEAARQRELDSYRAVDSLPDAAYDDIVSLASQICGAPIALVSLIDRDRQWFKARLGFEQRETRRDEAFCNQAILAPESLMEIPDARHDPRFAENPFVTGDASIRFYAGMPLVTLGGAAIGTVCVLDREPRTLTDAQRSALASLARLTMHLLESSHRERSLERAALLSSDTAAPMSSEIPAQTPQPTGAGCTIAIFEVQDISSATAQPGERTLQRLEQLFEAAFEPGSGDSVSRVSGNAELIVLLHGSQAPATLQKLRDCLPAYERETKLRVLSAHSEQTHTQEPLETVFQRADEALTCEKDAYRAKLATQAAAA